MPFTKKNPRKSERGWSASFASSSTHDIDTDGSDVLGHGPSNSRHTPGAPRSQTGSGTSSGHKTNGAVRGKIGRFLGSSNHQSSGSSIEASQNEENEARAAPTKLHTVECLKHPGHKEFIPIDQLQMQHLPAQYQHDDWVKFIKLKGNETVHISVNYTSEKRPDDFGFKDFKGTTTMRTGSGTAFIMNMDNIEDCSCGEIEGAHKVSGNFKVMTVAHVVFDDEEARSTEITFFYDDDNDNTITVTARGERVSHIDIRRNRSVFECRTHDLTLFQRLSSARDERMRLIQSSLSKKIHQEPMVVLISHPHGKSKYVSIGKLLAIEEDGDIKETKDGVELVSCFLTYDTPTCPGTGGGSINLIGKEEVCYAFAPHCASHSNGLNTSGLGWTKYVKSLQLRG